jgi:hypothetical protein
VFRVGWLPRSTTHFASGGDDSFLFLWDISRVGAHQVRLRPPAPPPPPPTLLSTMHPTVLQGTPASFHTHTPRRGTAFQTCASLLRQPGGVPLLARTRASRPPPAARRAIERTFIPRQAASLLAPDGGGWEDARISWAGKLQVRC